MSETIISRDAGGRRQAICYNCIRYAGHRWSLFGRKRTASGTWLYIERYASGAAYGQWVPEGATVAVRPKSLRKQKPRGKAFVKGDSRIKRRAPARAA